MPDHRARRWIGCISNNNLDYKYIDWGYILLICIYVCVYVYVYLFTGCCQQNDHSTNISEPGYSSNLLSKTIGLRNSLKKFVAGLGISRCHVLDSCCVANCPVTANTATRLEALKRVCARDGVHFTSGGYDNLVASINKSEALLADTPSCASMTKRQHYWRGFRSTNGSASGPITARGGARGGKTGCLDRGGRHFRPFHPYRREK